MLVYDFYKFSRVKKHNPEDGYNKLSCFYVPLLRLLKELINLPIFCNILTFCLVVLRGKQKLYKPLTQHRIHSMTVLIISHWSCTVLLLTGLCSSKKCLGEGFCTCNSLKIKYLISKTSLSMQLHTNKWICTFVRVRTCIIQYTLFNVQYKVKLV